jgi:hypothetical protein
MRVQFKKKKNSTQDTLITFAYKSVEIEQQGKNILLNYSSASEILLPLDLNQDSTATTFIFHRIHATDSINNYATDTIRIGYTKQTKVISKDCGAYTYYKNQKILHKNLTDSQIKIYSTSLLKDPTGSASALTSYALNYQILY